MTGQRSNQLPQPAESTTYVKSLQRMALQDLHITHPSLAVHTVAAVPAKTAHENRCAHARFILTQMPARRETHSQRPKWVRIDVGEQLTRTGIAR